MRVRLGRSASALLLASALAALPRPSAAVTVNPFFAGSTTIDKDHPFGLAESVYDNRLIPLFGQNRVDVDVEHALVSDGGTLGEPEIAGNWSFDMSLWAPLMSNLSIQNIGQLTYGFPAADVFAVTWVDVPNTNDPTVHNTFQVLFIGASGYTTNTGFAI